MGSYEAISSSPFSAITAAQAGVRAASSQGGFCLFLPLLPTPCLTPHRKILLNPLLSDRPHPPGSKHTMAFYCPGEWNPTSSVGLKENLILKIINHLRFCQSKTADFLHECSSPRPHTPTDKATGLWLLRRQTHPALHALPYLLSVSCAGKESCVYLRAAAPRPAPPELDTLKTHLWSYQPPLKKIRLGPLYPAPWVLLPTRPWEQNLRV